MNKLSFSLLVLIALAINLPAQKTEEEPWVTLEPKGAGFSVLLPAPAIENIDKKASYTLHAFTVTVDRTIYVASYSDYEPGKLQPKTALAANRDRFNKSLQATLISSRGITVGGKTGIEFTSETPAHNVKSQLFLIGNRMFQTATLVPKGDDDTKNVDRFFESFKFKRR